MSATVIDMREWVVARARNAKVRWLIAAIDRYCAGQGPHDALAKAMVARRLTDASWAIVDGIAADLAHRAGRPFLLPSSALTRQLTVDQLGDDAREIRLAAIETTGASR